jgi:hypothetical protein
MLHVGALVCLYCYNFMWMLKIGKWKIGGRKIGGRKIGGRKIGGSCFAGAVFFSLGEIGCCAETTSTKIVATANITMMKVAAFKACLVMFFSPRTYCQKWLILKSM